MHYFDVDAKKWKQLSKFKTLIERPSLIVVEGKLYSAGGHKHATIEDESDYGASSDLSDYEDVQHFRNRRSRGSYYSWEESYLYDSDDDDEYIYHDLNVSRKKFLCYNASLNKWEPLPSMKKARQSFPMVSLDGYIYAIGGYDEHRKLLIGDVERFSIAKDEWESLASLPEGFHWVSAVTYDKKILAYGISGSVVTSNDPAGKVTRSNARKHVLHMYDPSTKAWQCIDEEDHTTSVTYGNNLRALISSEALLFKYKDHCYRVLYKWHTSKKAKDTSGRKSKEKTPLWPSDLYLKAHSVAVLELKPEGDNSEVSVGESINQDLIGGNRVGAFHIQNEVFVNVNGSVFKTELKIGAEQTEKVNLHGWKGFKIAKEHSNVVYFTFDQQKLGYYKR